MKKLISLIMCVAPLISMAQKNNTYTVEGKISTPATVTLQYKLNGKTVEDATEVSNGAFKLTGIIDDKISANLSVQPHKQTNGRAEMGSMFIFWLEPGDIKVSDLDSTRKGPVFSGTPLNDENNELTREELPLKNIPYGKQKDSVRENIIINFIKAHPNSMLSLTELNYSLSAEVPDVAVVGPLFNGLSADVKVSALGKEYQQMLIKWKMVNVGSIVPDFTQNDTSGKPISLINFRGKYVLLDFWASWCNPCRAENPNVVKAYQQYKSKNFTVLSVSLDQQGKKDAWLAAIKADGLEWTQVSDLKSWKNEVAQKYGVTSIPQNFLIDPNGKIIGKDLRGDDLDKKLASLFN